MRIRSRAIWLFSASLAFAAADDPTLTFDATCFNGIQFGSSNSSILVYKDANGISGTTAGDTKCNTGDGYQFLFWTSRDISVQNVFIGDLSTNGSIATSYLTDHPEGPERPGREDAFPVQWGNGSGVGTQGSLTLPNDFVNKRLSQHQGIPLFFQVEWDSTSGTEKRDDPGALGHVYGYSQGWAISDESDEDPSLTSVYTSNPTLTPGASPVFPTGSSPVVSETSAFTTTATVATSSSATSSSEATSTSSTVVSASHHGGRSLSVGAIVGIALGGLAGLVLISLVLGCLCLRRRRGRRGAGGDGSSRDVQAMQDLIAEKERRAGIADNAPDTPYSEEDGRRDLQRPLTRGPGMSGPNGSGADVTSGAQGAAVSVHSGSHFADTRRGSAGYSSLRGATAVGTAVTAGTTTTTTAGGSNSGDSPTHAHPSSSISLHDRSSLPQQQQERAFSPYRDHHQLPASPHGVDGAAQDRSPTTPDDDDDDDEEEEEEEEEDEQHWHHPTPPPGSTHDNGSAGGSGTGTPQLGPARFVRSTTPGISEQYAHLVEEGMTLDEIRRLEEEERVLDEAIEQARTESRAAGR